MVAIVLTRISLSVLPENSRQDGPGLFRQINDFSVPVAAVTFLAADRFPAKPRFHQRRGIWQWLETGRG